MSGIHALRKEASGKLVFRQAESLAMLASWSQTSTFQNCEKSMFIVDKPPGLWYFVRAAQ